MKTVFLGDSLTAGMPGVSYWRFLSDKSKLINRGLGGDTLAGATGRAEKMLRGPGYDDVDQYGKQEGGQQFVNTPNTAHRFE